MTDTQINLTPSQVALLAYNRTLNDQTTIETPGNMVAGGAAGALAGGAGAALYRAATGRAVSPGAAAAAMSIGGGLGALAGGSRAFSSAHREAQRHNAGEYRFLRQQEAMAARKKAAFADELSKQKLAGVFRNIFGPTKEAASEAAGKLATKPTPPGDAPKWLNAHPLRRLPSETTEDMYRRERAARASAVT